MYEASSLSPLSSAAGGGGGGEVRVLKCTGAEQAGGTSFYALLRGAVVTEWIIQQSKNSPVRR